MVVKKINLSNILTSLLKRCQFCFKLDTLVIVKVDVFIYEEASLLIGLKLNAVNALGFENRKEIFCQSVVIRIATS